MSDPINDKAFDEYLQRGSALSQQYRTMQDDEPPSHLDQQVLAQAEGALRAESIEKSRRWKRWSVPVALAASTLIAVSVVLESGMQREVTSSAPLGPTMTDEAGPAEVATSTEPEVDSSAVDEAVGETQRSRDMSETLVHADTSVTTAAAPVEAPAFTPDPAIARKTERAAQAPMRVEEERRGEQSTGVPGQTASESKVAEPVADEYSISRASAPARAEAMRGQHSSVEVARPAAAADQAQLQLVRDPTQWLAEIRELREAGRTEEADRQWKQFESAFPDYEVADDDVARPSE